MAALTILVAYAAACRLATPVLRASVFVAVALMAWLWSGQRMKPQLVLATLIAGAATVLAFGGPVLNFVTRGESADQIGTFGCEADEVAPADGGTQLAQTDLIILTHDTREGTMDGALALMQALPSVLQPITRIRKEELA